MSFSGFLYLLAVLFIGLKLTGEIDWSWVLVLAPIWVIPAFFVLAFAAIVVAAAVLIPLELLFKALLQRKRRRL